MSANKTTNYKLHAWAPGDDFLRQEFNENFAKIDAIYNALVVGSYQGDDASERVISVGFTPRVVVVLTRDGFFRYARGCCGGIVIPGAPMRNNSNANSPIAMEITEGGFKLYRGTNPDDGPSSNYSHLSYRYFALR